MTRGSIPPPGTNKGVVMKCMIILVYLLLSGGVNLYLFHILDSSVNKGVDWIRFAPFIPSVLLSTFLLVKAHEVFMDIIK